MAIRSKSQVLLEEWGTFDVEKIKDLPRQRYYAPAPPIEKWTTLQLPYQAPSCPPLPSWEQILEATASHGLHDKRTPSHSVCRIGDTAVKYSSSPNIVEEAENLLFLADKRPKLRITTVLAVWTVINEGQVIYCLMMNFIEGDTLTGDIFAGFSQQAQDIICKKISSQIRYLRELDSDYYGRVHGQGWLNAPTGIVVETGASKSVTGPYKTYEELVSAMCRADELRIATIGTKPEWNPNSVLSMAKRRASFSSWNPHEPKFTWLDPKMANMIVQPIKSDEVEDWDVFLIDWENAGWFPAWMQLMQFSTRCGIMVKDATKARGYPLIPYRNKETFEKMVQDFDPEPDWDRFKSLGQWSLY